MRDQDHTKWRRRIPANSSGDDTPRRLRRRERAGYYRDRIRGWSHPRPRDVRNSCWDCGCRHLMAPSSLLGEGRAKSRDHRLPLLEIPFPLFLSLCLSLSATTLPPLFLLPRSPAPSLARQRRSPFNSVLPSSSSSQNDSTSTGLNRSCESVSSRVHTCCPSFANRVLLSRVSSRGLWNLVAIYVDAIARRADWYRRRVSFFFLYPELFLGLSIRINELNVECIIMTLGSRRDLLLLPCQTM